MVTVAPAVPLPRLSLPLASMTARWAASSRSTKAPVPEYTSAIGPSLTFTVPANPSSVTSVTVAPGKQPPTRGRSMKVAQVWSTVGGHGEGVAQLHGLSLLPRRGRPVGSSTVARCLR